MRGFYLGFGDGEGFCGGLDFARGGFAVEWFDVGEHYGGGGGFGPEDISVLEVVVVGEFIVEWKQSAAARCVVCAALGYGACVGVPSQQDCSPKYRYFWLSGIERTPYDDTALSESQCCAIGTGNEVFLPISSDVSS